MTLRALFTLVTLTLPFAQPSKASAANAPVPSNPSTSPLHLVARDLPWEGTGFVRDNEGLAIDVPHTRAARLRTRFGQAPGRYDITLHAMRDAAGPATFELSVDDKRVGSFECPPAMAPGANDGVVTHTWRNVDVERNDFVELAARSGSKDGQAFSRARWSMLTFAPSARAPSDLAAAPVVLPRQPDGNGVARVEGELRQWHKVTLSLAGPYAHERDHAPNAFRDHELLVTFEHSSGSPRYTVPGYFAADGNAAESGAEAGTVWRAHVSPDKPGRWNYRVAFRRGRDTAVGGEGTPLAPYDGKSGSFEIAASNKTGADFRARGRLAYVGSHHLRFANGDYFLKAGPDSPETFLGSADFDGTVAFKSSVPLKTWAPHVRDWRPGDPEWRQGKGHGLIGALNYLASKGLNAFSFLTYNAAGDGDNVWPFVSREAKFHYDCSKLDQWGIVFDHATRLGLYLHFKLQETEQDDQRRGAERATVDIPESLDGGVTGPERKLYLRELVARFGHALALNWNLGEENTQTTAEQRAMADYLGAVDPYRHPIVLHTYPNDQDKVYNAILGPDTFIAGPSLQNTWNAAHARTLKWRALSAGAGRPWICANDEQGPASLGVPPDPGYEGFDGIAADGNHRYNLDDVRKATLWGNLMAGGAGVEYYFGYRLPQNDLLCEDFRSREKSWDYCRIALQFFHEHRVPFWEMATDNALLGNRNNDNSRYCFAKAGAVYLVYLPQGGAAELDLTGAAGGKFSVSWFNPRTGGPLASDGDATGGTKVSLRAPTADDWLAMLRRR